MKQINKKSNVINSIDKDIIKAKKYVDKTIINSINKLKDILDINFYADYSNPIEYADKYHKCQY
jgi:hypothetical protein